MKKIILVAMAAVVSTAAFSQVKWGVQASGSLNSLSVKAEGADMFKKTSTIGFGAGITSEIQLSSQVSLRPSLNLLQKGGKLKSAFDDLGGEDGGLSFPSIEIDNKLYYAELPVTVVYNVNMSTGKLFFGAGPSVGYGLFGKTKFTSTNPFDPSEKEEEKIDAFKKDEDGNSPYKRFSISANALAGYQWNSGLYVNAGYLLGLSNMIESENGESMKSRGLQLTVGFFFNKKK